jgi:hypothetical protein
MYSQTSSDDYLRPTGHGLNIINAGAKPPVIQELGDTQTQAPAKPAEVHELDGLSRR